MIDIDGVSKRFGHIQALEQVSVRLKRGEITGLLGLNGAGKSTLMRLMYGLLVPDTGRIVIDDLDVALNPDQARQRLGVLPDDCGLYKRLTARENIDYFGQLQGVPAERLSVVREQLIDYLGMHGIADRRAEGFSLGEKMKTALVRAIVHQPDYILLDEPTNGLDVITTRAVRRLLLSLRDQGKCILFSSHLMHEVGHLCDRVLIMSHGKLVADGSIPDVIAQVGASTLEDAFVTLSGVQETTYV